MNCSVCNKKIPFWENKIKYKDGYVCFDCYENEIKDQVKKEKSYTKNSSTNTSAQSKSVPEESFFSPEGRIRRSTYFFRTLFLAIPPGIFSLVSQGSQEAGLIILSAFVMIGFGIVQIIQAIKRLHDINLNGGYVLLGLFPVINIIFGLYLLFKDGTKGTNEYGEDPKKGERTSKNKTKSSSSTINKTTSNRTQSSTNSSQTHGLDDLEKLADLRNKGIITEEEFAAKKKQILGL